MATEEKADQPVGFLNGWKGIASYLGVEKSTAQRWAKQRGLPVRRLPGGGGVVADRAELDAWRKAGLPVGPAAYPNPMAEPVGQKIGRRQWLRTAGFGGAVVVVAAAGFAVPKLNLGGREPLTGYRVSGATLIVLGKDGGELWRHTFPEQLSEGAYSGQTLGERCLFSDLDGDGRTEAVFSYIPKRWESQRSLVCFSSLGKPLWKFVAGKPVIDNFGREFVPPFWPNRFEVLRSRNSKAAQIVVSSHHNWSFPTQVAVLDGKTGRVVSEYWHRGHLLHMAVADLDGDGEAKVVLGGVNDALEYKQATLVVFDHRLIAGASRNPNGGVYFQGMAPGTERNILFFPKTPFSQHMEFNRVSVVRVANGRIRINVAESTDERDLGFVVYELDFRLKPITVALSNVLMERYREAQTRGEFPSESIENIAERLKSRVRVI